MTVQGRSPGASRLRAAGLLFIEFVAFAALLFATRFVCRGHLAISDEEECTGGIAVDVLAHGVRFPLAVYAENPYDNGFFFSGLLTAASFSLLGRNVLTMKLVAHLIAAAGAVATLSLLQQCLREMGLTGRRTRWPAIIVVVVAIAVAPTVVTVHSMLALGIGAHAEGSAITTILLALFSQRVRTRSVGRTAVIWGLTGLALYVNTAMIFVIPVLVAAELAIGWRSPARLAAAFGGFALGALPELAVTLQRQGGGWAHLAFKAEDQLRRFPRAFVEGMTNLGEGRIELLAVWAIGLIVQTALCLRSWIGARHGAFSGAPHGSVAVRSVDSVPATLCLVVGVAWYSLAVLSVVAQGGMDHYVIEAYPTIIILFGVTIAWLCAQVSAQMGQHAGAAVGAVAVLATVLIYRPRTATCDTSAVVALWRNRTGAVCSYRFADGFARQENSDDLAAPSQAAVQHIIEGCRRLSEEPQILDCIGGLTYPWSRAMDAHKEWANELPAGLNPDERRAFAYYYGLKRHGETTVCTNLKDPDLIAQCVAAAQLECLVYSDFASRLFWGRPLPRPRCAIAEPPMQAYWAAARADLDARPATTEFGHLRPELAKAVGRPACSAVIEACF
jgi:hypothetical protein